MRKVTRVISIFLSLQLAVIPLYAQKKKEKNKVIPANAHEKQRKNLEEKQAQYQGSKEAHKKKQDQATQKRMKKNLKRAQKHSWGKEVPWYKRWFRKSKV